jgi:hypothetical protein
VIIGILCAGKVLVAVGSEVGVQLNHRGARRDRVRTIHLNLVVILRARERYGCGKHKQSENNSFQAAILSVRIQE